MGEYKFQIGLVAVIVGFGVWHYGKAARPVRTHGPIEKVPEKIRGWLAWFFAFLVVFPVSAAQHFFTTTLNLELEHPQLLIAPAWKTYQIYCWLVVYKDFPHRCKH